MRREIDVVIAARNESRHIGECLESLARQNYGAAKVHIWIVDDRSTDSTAEIARSFGARVLTGAGRGPGAARNLAIRTGRAGLLAFLDGHCVIDANWMSRMAGAFEDESVGGAMSTLECRADDPRVRRYLPSTAGILEDSILGKRNLYPWLLSGCSMFRRTAIELAGGFDETLSACEDVDISWKVLLSGYLLSHVPDAITIHHETRSLSQFLTKGKQYGKGAAQLTRRYRQHGAKNKFKPQVWKRENGAAAGRWSYALGYLSGYLGLLRNDISVAPLRPAVANFRPAWLWAPKQQLRISDAVVFWFRPDPSTVFVHVPDRARFVLDGVGDFIGRRLVGRRSRSELIADMVTAYGIAGATAAFDLDDYVEELLAARVLERELW